MINIAFKFRNLLKLLIFIPITFYFGKRSLIGFDEGFYALQARWILDKGNWTIPLWFDNYVLDRTIGLQFLIAKSQQIFGRNIFWAYLPTTIAAIIMSTNLFPKPSMSLGNLPSSKRDSGNFHLSIESMMIVKTFALLERDSARRR